MDWSCYVLLGRSKLETMNFPLTSGWVPVIVPLNQSTELPSGKRLHNYGKIHRF